MKRWAALTGVILAAQLCFATVIGQLTQSVKETGKAFITQAGSVSGVDNYFGDNWGSVRMFPLMGRPATPIRVYVETNPRSGLYKPHYRDYVNWSLSSWNQALNGRLSYTMVNSRQNADITIDWVPGFSDRYVAGVTTYQVGHADIEIKASGIPDKDVKANIIHEFGHALGIAGHSNNQADIMVGSRRWNRNGGYEPRLSSNDIHAIQRLYSETWRRGEDLYSTDSQRASLPQANTNIATGTDGQTIMNSATNAVINLIPLDNHVSGLYPTQQ